MSQRLRMVLLLLCWFAHPAVTQARGHSKDDLKQTLDECVKWLGETGIVQKQAKPSFVRTQRFGRLGTNTMRDSVLLEVDRDASNVRCLTLDLLPQTVSIKPVAVPGARPFQPLDYRHGFLLFRREFNQRLKVRPDRPLDQWELIEVVTFLLISKNAGEMDSYNELAATIQSNETVFAKLNKRRLATWLARSRIHSLGTQMGGWPEAERPLVSRTQLLGQVRLFLKRFPESDHARHAKQMVPLLEKSIADEKQHPAASPDEIRAMAKRKDVTRLIEQLQYVAGMPRSNINTFPSLFAGFGLSRAGRGEGPAHELARLGDVAVPKLIEALADTRLTYLTTSQHVWLYQKMWMDDGYSRVLSCGECAAQILDEIMPGEAFASEFKRTGLFAPKPHLKKIEQRARKWWDEYQESDRTEFWIRKLETNERGFSKIAERLFRANPKRATVVLVPLIDKRPSYNTRFLIESIAETKPAGYRDFLSALTKSDSPSVRLAAIGESWKLNKQTSLDALWRDWQLVVSDTLPKDVEGRDSNYVGELSKFLLASGPTSIDRIRNDLPQLNAYNVKLVMWRLPVIWKYYGQDEEKRQRVIAWRGTPEGKAVTRLLLAASGDQRRAKKYSSGFPDYRVCDQAALELHKLLDNPPGPPTPPRRRPEDPEDRTAAQAELDREFNEYIPEIRELAQKLLQ